MLAFMGRGGTPPIGVCADEVGALLSEGSSREGLTDTVGLTSGTTELPAPMGGVAPSWRTVVCLPARSLRGLFLSGEEEATISTAST